MDWREASKLIAAEVLRQTDDVNISETIDCFIDAPAQSSDRAALLTDYEKIQGWIIGAIKKQLQQEIDNGLSRRFEFSNVAPDVLISLRDPSFDSAVADMSQAIENLSWRAFEHFSRHVLRINGVQPCKVLRGTKEEGIDLCGLMDLSPHLPSAIWKNATLRVLGQVKKARVGQPDVRLFHTDLSSCARGEGEGHRQTPDWFKASKAPVLGFVFAFRGFAGTARTWAKTNGILTKDSRQMIDDILTSPRGTPGVLQIGGTTQFIEQAFTKHFASIP